MSKETPLNFQLIKQGITLVSGLSILSSSLAIAQTDSTPATFVIPDVPAAAPAPAPAPAPPALKKAPKPVAPVQIQAPQAAPVAPAPKKVQLSTPRVTVPSNTRTQTRTRVADLIPKPQPIVNQPSTSSATPSKNTYVDPTNYNDIVRINNPPTAVILTERNRGCNTVVKEGKLSGSCGSIAAKVKKEPINPQTLVRTNSKHKSKPIPPLNPDLISQKNHNNPVKSVNIHRKTQVVSQYRQKRYLSPPPTLEPNTVSLSQAPEYSRITTYVPHVPQGNTALLFPVSIPASITSAFGWRVHPISNTVKMHTGTDIAAPTGTPVLAAYHGRVEIADAVGGYGLMVILRHVDGTQESRYAHLSEIFVQPGEWVEQGKVIGLVGSTGNSTGPHLHFEWRHLTNEGWVAVDAGLHLQYAMDNLIKAMQMANTGNQENGG